MFSVIIPIYNAEKSLEAAVSSIMSQTYSDWELLLVDDCSTDGSFRIENEFAESDARIRVFRLPQNSGNAKKPCDLGVKNSQGEFCVILGNDDELRHDYLQIMADTIKRHSADVVLPVMVSMNHEREVETGRISKPETVCEEVITGKNACRLALPEWRIGCNGMAFNKRLYQHVLEENPYNYAYSDEFSERLILYYAKTVAFSDAEYIYWQNSTSITHKKSVKLYEILSVDKQLLDFALAHYDTETVEDVFRSMLCHLISLQKDAIKDAPLYSTEEKKRIKEILHQAFCDMKQVSGIRRSFKEHLLLLHPAVFQLICRFKI